MRRLLAAASLGIIFLHAATADTLPLRKSGLWQNTMTITATNSTPAPKPGAKAPPASPPPAPAQLVTVVCDPSDDLRLVQPRQDAQEHCPPASITAVPGPAGTYKITEICKQPDGHTLTMVGTLVYQGDSATHLTMRMTSPSMSNVIQIDSKWLGACPAGAAPGDLGMLVDGKFKKLVNINTPPK